MPISVSKVGIQGALLITPQRHADSRGWFEESWSRRDLAAAGITCDFVQDNHSTSLKAGTLRGLHYQPPPHAQAKLVRCTRGAIFDVIVDARQGSETYGRWIGNRLSAEIGNQLFVPAGLLHGFLTLQDDTHVQYRCSDYYSPECDGAIRWDSLDIDWPLEREPILSQRDAQAIGFAEFVTPFVEGTAG